MVKLGVGLGLSIANRGKALQTQALTAVTKSTIPKITQPLLMTQDLSHITHQMITKTRNQ